MPLRLATDAEKRTRDALTFDAWGSGLTAPQFLAREQRLRAHPWARAAMRTWLWTDDHDAALASCETFECASHVGGAPGRSWVVASVYVAPPLRRRGHSAAMLAALVARLRGEVGAQAITLFSEVGTALYARVGFRPAPSFDTWFTPADAAPDEVAWLSAPLAAPATQPPAPHALRLTVDAGQVDWHLARERFYGEALGQPALATHGARVGGSTIAWTAYWRSGELHVLWLDVVASAHRAPLVDAARAAAARAGLSAVRIWETTPLDDLPGARRAPRDDEIAMFTSLGPPIAEWTHVDRALWA
jgi:GNAT superfamily N-acetyltransferase